MQPGFDIPLSLSTTYGNLETTSKIGINDTFITCFTYFNDQLYHNNPSLKPVLEHLLLAPEESFVVKSFDYAYYPTPWHYHPEYEIVLITSSTGTRFIGDSMALFDEGDLVFIGPNVPHLYRNDEAYYAHQPAARAKSIVVHFLENIFGEKLLTLPESRSIKSLLAKSLRGLEVGGATKVAATKMLKELTILKGFPRWLKLLEILQLLSVSDELVYVSKNHIVGVNGVETDRMNRVFDFVLRNYQREITVKEVADIANLASNSFSRFFSQRTRKTFVEFVNEVRLSHACKLLQENKLSVSDICYASGYNNLSNFNRQFKKLYKVSPLVYARQFSLTI